MNILVIGNGFDLAHGLPTKYTDFLEFCKRVDGIYTYTPHVEKNIKEWDINNEIKQILEAACKSREPVYPDKKDIDKVSTKVKYMNEFYACIKENFWIEYFIKCNMNSKENWIDFENEMSEVVQSIDDDMHIFGDKSFRLENNIQKISNFLLNAKYYGLQKTYKDERDDLLNDLNRLIRALEIYLDEFVKKIKIKKKNIDIEKLEVDFILSFNYTQTFSKVYQISERAKKMGMIPFDYIHGKADVENKMENDNMVLGINEYLSEERKDKDVDFIAFKKYYQRIYKETGCEYKTWISLIQKKYDKYLENKDYKKMWRKARRNRILRKEPKWTEEMKRNEEKNKVHHIYFFGHSLDVTDKDILRDLVLCDNVQTTIFYFNKEDLNSKITNLVKVIGQDELIRRTGGSRKTIEFKLQQDMVERT